MQSEWQAHLERHQANINALSVSDFGHPDQERNAVTGNIITDLSHYA